MRTATLRLEDMKTTIINMGYVGENEHKQIRFDGKKMFQEYPNASVSLTVCPACGEAYPATIERDGDFVLWTITDSDLVAEGCGEIQLTFTESPHIAKSYICRTNVLRSLVPTGDIPSGLDDFITRADALLEELEDAIPEGGTTGQVLAKKSNDDYDTEWVNQGSGGTSDYTDLTNKPQIGGVTLTGNKTLHDLGAATEEAVGAKYTKPSSGIPASDMADGVIPVLTDLIDDTAGDGDTNKVWSADKSSALLTEINSKYEKPSGGIPATDLASGVIPAVPVQDVQINGTSILNAQGVANVPIASSTNPGAVVVKNAYGLQMYNDGSLAIAMASMNDQKNGAGYYKPVVPQTQEYSVFYGLAKAAGADMAQSSNPMGQFTDAAKVAIQKMLGVYEAPWELIRQETITNETASDIEITVDGNGNPFELTDIVVWFNLIGDGSQATYGDYGRSKYYYSNSDSDDILVNTITAASGVTRVFYTYVEQKNGLIKKYAMNNTQHGNTGSLFDYATSSFSSNLAPVVLPGSIRAYNKIVFRQVTGKASFRIFGKRKWN